jgi:hypothetical protein
MAFQSKFLKFGSFSQGQGNYGQHFTYVIVFELFEELPISPIDHCVHQVTNDEEDEAEETRDQPLGPDLPTEQVHRAVPVLSEPDLRVVDEGCQ